jgi:mannan endo-1,4-beta-mannosidase
VTEAEAEQGALQGVNVSSVVPGFSGTGYVTGFDNTGDQVTVSVDIPAKDLYMVMIRYLGKSGEKFQDFSVNAGFSSVIRFPASDTFAYTEAGKYYLEAGTNTLTLGKNWGWSDIDKFEIYYTEKNTYDISHELVDTACTDSTLALYTFLRGQFRNNIISARPMIITMKLKFNENHPCSGRVIFNILQKDILICGRMAAILLAKTMTVPWMS